MYVRDDIYIKRLKNFEVPDLSVLMVLVDTGATQNGYTGVYRSHSGDPEITRLFVRLSEAADEAQQRYPAAQLFVLGDFNVHHKEWLFPYQTTDHAGREARKFSLSLNL